MKARPTEYKGIRFRSKSEAVFARYLDLLIETRFFENTLASFEYEPETCVEGWHPDFLTWRVMRPMGSKYGFRRTIPDLFMTFIEYKPSRPTQTYIREWAECAAKWSKLATEKQSPFKPTFFIYYGSVYSSADRGVVYVDSIGGTFNDNQDDWIVDFEDELKSYRFDLQQQAVT